MIILLISVEFVQTPLDSEVDAGSTFLWDCTATGRPTPVMKWEKDGAALLPGYPKHISILANNSLMIQGVKPEDAGQYQCHAINEVGVHVVQAELLVRGKKCAFLVLSVFLGRLVVICFLTMLQISCIQVSPKE